MYFTRPTAKPTQRVDAYVSETTKRTLKRRVVVSNTDVDASSGVPIHKANSKSLFSKIKLAVAPPKVLHYKNDAQISPANSSNVPAQERVNKSKILWDKDMTPPSKIPHLKRVASDKGVSIFTKFKRVMGISKIPRLKHLDQHNLQYVPSPVHSICRSDPFAASGDSFYHSDKRIGIGAIHALATKPVVEDIQVEACRTPPALILPPVKPLNIVKKRSILPVQANVMTPSTYMDSYPRLRKPTISSNLGIAPVPKSTGLPPNYCIAGVRYHTPCAPDARETIPTIVSSQANQLTKNVNVAETFEHTPELLRSSSNAVVTPCPRQSTFSKINQSICKSARSIFKPATLHRTRVPPALVLKQSSIRPSVGRTTTFVDITQSAPLSEENSIRKPTIFFSPAKKAHRPRGSFPPISGLMTPDKCRSAHGICQLRRQGKATSLVCICYRKFMKSRQKFANYAPAILSDIIEDRPVTFFPRRRSFNLDSEARYLLSLHLGYEVELSVQNVSQTPQLVSRAPRTSSSSSLFVSNEPLVCSSPSVFVSPSCSVSTQAQSLEHVHSSVESVFLSVSDNSLDDVSLCVSENVIEPVTSLMEGPLESLSLLSISDEDLKPTVPLSPSFSILDEYFDTISLSPSPSILSSNESLESISSRTEGLDVTRDALNPRDPVAISSECHTPSNASVLDIPFDNLRSFDFNTQALSKKNNRSARILPSTSLGLGICVNVNSNEHFCPAPIQHEISVDAIEKSRLGSPVMEPKGTHRLGRFILPINTSTGSASLSALDCSSDTATTLSQDNGDGLSSMGETPTSSSISSVDVEYSRSRRAAIQAHRLPIGVASSPPSRRIAVYGSVSPRQRASPVPCASLPIGLSRPLCFVDAINRSAVQDESVQRPVAGPDPNISMTPTSLTRHERSFNGQYAVPQRTGRYCLTAPLPF